MCMRNREARQRKCAHARSVRLVTDGLERTVCEACGQVNIRYESMISGEVDRGRFSRIADRLNHGAHVRH